MSEKQTNADKFLEALLNETKGELVQQAYSAVGLGLMAADAELFEIEQVKFNDDIPIEKMYFSIGHVCQLLQCSPVMLRRTMNTIGVKFDHDVVYIDGLALVAVSRCLSDRVNFKTAESLT
jgi:hypothetical protein